MTKWYVQADAHGRIVGRASVPDRDADAFASVCPHTLVPIDPDLYAEMRDAPGKAVVDGKIVDRTKVTLTANRQRLYCQPSILWRSTDAEANRDGWAARTVFEATDVIPTPAGNYQPSRLCITGDAEPTWANPAHREYMPPVEWKPATGQTSAEARKAGTIYEAGEFASDPADATKIYEVDKAGVTNPNDFDFAAGTVDRDHVEVSWDGPAPVIVNVGGVEAAASSPVHIVRGTAGQAAVKIDDQAAYSDPLIISAEEP